MSELGKDPSRSDGKGITLQQFFSKINLPLYGALGAVLTAAPALFVVGIAVPGDAAGYAVGLGECVLLPVAAILGALGGATAPRISRWRNPKAQLGLAAILTGAGLGLVLAIGVALWALVLPCGRGGACLF